MFEMHFKPGYGIHRRTKEFLRLHMMNTPFEYTEADTARYVALQKEKNLPVKSIQKQLDQLNELYKNGKENLEDIADRVMLLEDSLENIKKISGKDLHVAYVGKSGIDNPLVQGAFIIEPKSFEKLPERLDTESVEKFYNDDFARNRDVLLELAGVDWQKKHQINYDWLQEETGLEKTSLFKMLVTGGIGKLPTLEEKIQHSNQTKDWTFAKEAEEIFGKHLKIIGALTHTELAPDIKWPEDCEHGKVVLKGIIRKDKPEAP